MTKSNGKNRLNKILREEGEAINDTCEECGNTSATALDDDVQGVLITRCTRCWNLKWYGTKDKGVRKNVRKRSNKPKTA